MVSANLDFHDPIVAQLRQEFLSDAAERIDVIHDTLETINGSGDGVLLAIRREAHKLKGMGGCFDFPVVSLIARRLEDYLSGLQAVDARHVADIKVFAGHLDKIIVSGQDLDDEAAVVLLRQLPAHPAPESERLECRDLEALLVSPSLAVSQITAYALRSLGCRVTTARSAAEAIEIAVRTRPDLIVTSVIMDGVSGIDLVRALAAMSATEDLPSTVLTTFSKEHQQLKDLPSQVPVVRLGGALNENLAEVIAGFGLG